jgi:hypothetical protein
MPRRFQTLVQYGEGPHVTALMWIPLVIWLLDQAVANRRWKFLPLAAMSLAAVVLTNWTGTTGLLMALAAYVFSKIGAESAGGRSLHWPSFVGVGAVAYMLASFWVPPSLIQSVQASAAKLDVETPLLEKLWVLIPVALLMVCLHLVMQRMRVQSWTRFFLYYALISGIVLVSKVWWGTVLVPIAHRFHLEMEIALSAAAAMIALAIASRLPRAVQAAALAVLIVGGVILTRTYHRAARAMSQPIDFSTTTEFKQAQWFAQNMQNQRVFAGGTTSFWMNLYSDVPQVFGCCDQSARNDEIRMALYVIYSGEGTGDRDGEIATLWLKAYGASAISVMGNGTSQLGQPFGNPRKFDGVLQAAWRDGDSAIYRVPRPNNSLAHVVPNAALSQRRPINGIDIEPLLPLVDALDHPPSLATFRWINQHQAEVTAHTEAGQSIFIQETCDAGWHAGSEYTIACGPLGFMKIEPRTTGDHTIRLNYSGSTEDHIARGAQLAGVAILLIWTLRARRRPTAR